MYREGNSYWGRGLMMEARRTGNEHPRSCPHQLHTLLRAAEGGNLALIECADAVTGETRYVICAVGREDGDFVMTPFGHLADGNPYEAYVPPDASGGASAPAPV